MRKHNVVGWVLPTINLCCGLATAVFNSLKYSLKCGVGILPALSFGPHRELTVLHSNENCYKSYQRRLAACLLLLSCLFLIGTPPALANINDDRFDGNVFVLYGGNNSLVPPKITLAASLEGDKPTLLLFYVDDSSDCKRFAPVVTRLQAFYGRPVDFIAVNVDNMPSKSSYTPTEPGYYYEGIVPQVLVFNQSGKIVLNKKGQVPYEQVDDTFREIFDLLPRSESVELKRRRVNEFNTELAK